MKKKDILWAADYRYNFDRDLFVNRKARKAFSLEFVDDKDENEIRQRIGESTGDAGWTFYFNFPPSEGVKRELERVLG
jgi:ATP-dependent RNA circularization protein (DNA/RNA ligase family)